MKLVQLGATAMADSHITETLGWWDGDTDCTLVVSRPSTDPELWNEYLTGALRSYRKHGVECALNFDDIKDGHDTRIFFAAINTAGRVVGGVRAKGPLLAAEDSHAVVEWQGHPAQHAVAKVISDRLPFGVVEMKTAWVADEPDRNRCLTKTLARTALTAMVLLDAQFVMATAATHVLDRWRSSGGVVAAKIPAAAYPDERYRTKMMWWDRRTFANHAEPNQVSKMLAEMRLLSDRMYHFAGTDRARESGT